MASTEFTGLSDAVATVPASTTLLTSKALNATSALFTAPSVKDLALLPFRLFTKLDHLLFATIPRLVVRGTGLDSVAHWLIAFFPNADHNAAAGVAEAVQGGVVGDTVGRGWGEVLADVFQEGTFRSYWGMLQYLTSRWAFTCFVMALVLNRITVYGASRHRIVLTWNKRFALRLIPIMLFVAQIHQLLSAIRCQTSPDYSLFRHGDNNKYTTLDWSRDGGFVHDAASALLFWSDDHASCAAVGMSRPSPNVKASYGSFSLLWPTFLRLSLSHIIENLSCSLQQIPVMTEVGISVFEHSLAFAEAESMVSHALGIGTSSAKPTNTTLPSNLDFKANGTIPASGTLLAITDSVHGLTGPHVFNRINVPVEVLIVALISCCNALSSHIISVFGKQRQLRLLNTGFWGTAYIVSFIIGFFATSPMMRTDSIRPRHVSGLLHFPTVAIVGFLPHVIIIMGIIACGLIYLVALLLTAVSLGTNPNITQPTSLKERIAIAHDNLQVAVQLKGATVRWHEDFYTTLLRVGFAALTAASEAVFLNEGRSVEMRQFTWLEEERLDELEQSPDDNRLSRGSAFQIIEEYGIPGHLRDTMAEASQWQSGYDKERKFEKPKSKDNKKDGAASNAYVYPNPRTDGVGAMQRTTRFFLLFIFLRGVFLTIGGWFGFGIGALLDRLGITARPTWLRRLIGTSLKQVKHERAKARTAHSSTTLEFWKINEHGAIDKPNTDDYDIEVEMRRRVIAENEVDVDQALDEKMYNWWKSGGWYGTKDDSGDYQPPIQSIEADDDITSVVSMSTASTRSATDLGPNQDWESEPEGSRTPTQLKETWSFGKLREKSATPAGTEVLDHNYLARLLNPQDKATREEAKMLASHLSDDRIVTRSRYRKQYQTDRVKVLLAGRSTASAHLNAPKQSMDPHPLSSDEEADVLEQLLVTRRRQKARQRRQHSPAPNSATEQDKAAHQLQGPLCVVCQAEPRTIIAWPCRCLTVCEDCRVSLAMNNFGNCVTCRRNVGGFVRLYVP